VKLHDSVRAGGSEDRISGRMKFYTTLQTGPGVYPALYKIDIASISCVKQLELGVDHLPI
jgi:hypothetical protein